MAEKILQLNFKYSVTADEYHQAAAGLAGQFAAIDGLRWKIWFINDSEAGGLYMFESGEAASAFLKSPLAAQVTGHPAFSDFSVKLFDVMDEVTAITRGPVKLS